MFVIAKRLSRSISPLNCPCCGPISVLLIAAAVGVFYTVLHRPAASVDARTLNNQALQALEQRNPELAIGLLQEAVNLDPTCAEAHFNLAFACANYKRQAAELLHLDLRDLYAAILKEAECAHLLCPEDLEYAKSYALYCIDAEEFQVPEKPDAAIRAWNGYLMAHNRLTEQQGATRTRSIERYWILIRMSRIELELGDAAGAQQHLDQALALEIPFYEKRHASLESLKPQDLKPTPA